MKFKPGDLLRSKAYPKVSSLVVIKHVREKCYSTFVLYSDSQGIGLRILYDLDRTDEKIGEIPTKYLELFL